MTTQTINFEMISISAQKRFTCRHCGKKRQRTRKFGQTINPFNKGANGEVKDQQTIHREIREEAKVWLAAPELCKDCESLMGREETDEDDD